MSEKSNIAWCDSTINFWSGCAKVSEGCANCYAEARDKRHMQEKVSHWGKGAPRLVSKSAVKTAFALNRKPWICDVCGYASKSNRRDNGSCSNSNCDYHTKGAKGSFHRRRIFSLSLGDWLDREVPIEWLAEMLDTIRQCRDVTWILCTKRPELFHSRLDAVFQNAWEDEERTGKAGLNTNLSDWVADWLKHAAIPHNIILLTSVENQEQADKRIPALLKIPAACRGLSVEPMLGPINFAYPCFNGGEAVGQMPGIHWVIFGGESGPNARPCNIEWIREGVMQCKAAGVAPFAKQLGGYCVTDEATPDGWPAGAELIEGCLEKLRCVNLRDKKGGDMAEWLEDLRVREFPKL